MFFVGIKSGEKSLTALYPKVDNADLAGGRGLSFFIYYWPESPNSTLNFTGVSPGRIYLTGLG